MKTLLAFILFALSSLTYVNATDNKTIRISTKDTDLILQVGENGRLYQTYLGEKLLHEQDLQHFQWNIHAGSDGSVSKRGWEVYSGSGNEDFFEPAISITHHDGNPSTILYYVSSSDKAVEGGTETTILLRDDQYPVEVTLHYIAYPKENIIKTWSEIRHQEKKPVTLSSYASTMLYFNNSGYYLTEFSSDWAKEAQMSSQQLQFGKKVIDTKLGSRAAMHTHPFFEIGLDQPVNEHQGTVLMGTLGWTGNFRFTFEVDNVGNLRVIPAINPYASTYELKANEVFTTPEFIFTLSNNGTGQGSRNFHEWARNYGIKDGNGPRLTLLNNWENTAFNFNEEKLAALMKEAKHLGVDMFLLDDGWFGNKYPRQNDRAGLGDWEVTRDKLPGGIPALVRSAKDAGVKFGIWIEPEMVNPNSDLYRQHPDWVFHYPNRTRHETRNQLMLNLAREDVYQYLYSCFSTLLRENNIKFIKWDMNRGVTEPGFLSAPTDEQRAVRIKYIENLYRLFETLRAEFPEVWFENCAGGGGRVDLGMMARTDFCWASDNTDPVERTFIQYSFLNAFPSNSMISWVTQEDWHNQRHPLEFKFDVSLCGVLGVGYDITKWSDKEKEVAREKIALYKEIRETVHKGDHYRLISPYEHNRSVLQFVNKPKSESVVFVYNLAEYPDNAIPETKRSKKVKLRGLEPDASYRIEGMDGLYAGRQLMNIGVEFPLYGAFKSRIFKIVKQ